MELTKESKYVVDKDFELIHAIGKRISRNHKNSDDFIKQSAIAIYLKRGNDLRLDEDD